jgi:hypothetical protein
MNAVREQFEAGIICQKPVAHRCRKQALSATAGRFSGRTTLCLAAHHFLRCESGVAKLRMATD